MLRLGLRLLVASLFLAAVGWLAIGHWVWEAVRLSSVVCLALGMLLLILNYLRTPDPSGG